MEKYLSVLKECPLFEGIEDDLLLKLLSCLGARVARFDKKYTVMAEGSSAVYVGIVLSGSVQVEQVDFYGNRNILSTMGISQVFAEAFACAEVPSLPVTVVACEPCEVMLLDSRRILYPCSNACGFHQQLIFNLMRDLALKTLLFHQRIEVTSRRSTREKLLAYLALQAKAQGSSVFEIPYDRQALADYLGVDRSGLSSEIGKLQREGILRSVKNRFELL